MKNYKPATLSETAKDLWFICSFLPASRVLI